MNPHPSESRPRISRPDGLDRKDLLAALMAFGRGDFAFRPQEHMAGIDGNVSDTFNAVVELNDRTSGMDGHETMRTIRTLPRFRSVPIIAPRDKAAKGDRGGALKPALGS